MEDDWIEANPSSLTPAKFYQRSVQELCESMKAADIANGDRSISVNECSRMQDKLAALHRSLDDKDSRKLQHYPHIARATRGNLPGPDTVRIDPYMARAKAKRRCLAVPWAMLSDEAWERILTFSVVLPRLLAFRQVDRRIGDLVCTPGVWRDAKVNVPGSIFASREYSTLFLPFARAALVHVAQVVLPAHPKSEVFEIMLQAVLPNVRIERKNARDRDDGVALHACLDESSDDSDGAVLEEYVTFCCTGDLPETIQMDAETLEPLRRLNIRQHAADSRAQVIWQF